ncbi:MAG TPA: AraC family transcriptional regulator [Thermoanaerobaculia bacterium]|nr:AraC family transcriptional regulator [Thermoanaerobaculia bacterium]
MVELQAGFNETLSFSDHVLNLRISGTCRIRQNAAGRSLAGRSGPGSLNLIPAHFAARWEAGAAAGPSRTIAVFVPGAFLARVAEECGVESRKMEIIPQFLIHDPVIESTLTRLAIEAQSGSPSGQIYAESACEFLAHHLIHMYSSLSRPLSRSSGGLSGRRLQAVLDYIEESVADRITLRQLAELARVSPRHFERAFRESVGVPPHRYVIEKRVVAARHLLLSEPALSVERIAERVGFNSSSHFASAFRRYTGYSPSAFRRIHSR